MLLLEQFWFGVSLLPTIQDGGGPSVHETEKLQQYLLYV